MILYVVFALTASFLFTVLCTIRLVWLPSLSVTSNDSLKLQWLLVVPNASSIRNLLNSFKLNYAESIGVPTATLSPFLRLHCCVQVRFGQQNPNQLTRRCKSIQKVFEETCLPLKETPELSLDSHESVWNHVSLDFFKGYLMGSILSFRCAAKDVVQIASAVPFLSAAAVHLATAPIRSRCAVRETKGATRPGKHTKSYWTWPFIVDFPMNNGDVP